MQIDFKKFEAVASTSDEAKKLALSGAEPWTVVVANEQTGGHGRKGDEWFSPTGGLYFSIILPKSNIEDLQTLTILAAFIIAKTIKEIYGLEPLIKLPNDVLLNGKKICGILTENIIDKEIKTSVMGIGLNTNIKELPAELKGIATSLEIELKKEVDNEKIINQIIEGLRAQLEILN
ncbi:MAG: biotin--[acetyl-CoA-carboxylase] ligase [Candidatus Paceibacterota bacterium]